MHPRLHSQIIFVLLLLLSTAAAARTGISEREAEVYAVVIDHGLEPGTRMVVIADRTTGDAAALAADPDRIAAATAALGVPPAAFQDWTRRNARLDTIDRALKLKVSYQVVEQKPLAEMFNKAEPEAGWKQFFTHYVDAPGLLRLSHVGFDETGQHALIYLEHQCGAECGAGRLVYLVKEVTGWAVKTGTLVWMTN